MPHVPRRISALIVLALFLGATVLASRPSPRHATLGRDLVWNAPRPGRRARFAGTARALTVSVVRVARVVEADPSGARGSTGADSSFPRPVSSPNRSEDRGSDIGPYTSPPLRC